MHQRQPYTPTAKGGMIGRHRPCIKPIISFANFQYAEVILLYHFNALIIIYEFCLSQMKVLGDLLCLKNVSNAIELAKAVYPT